MLYILYGTDSYKARQKLNGLIKSLLSKKKDAMLIRIDNDNFSPSEVNDLASSQGLFENRSIIVFDSIFEDPTHKGILLDNLKSLKNSENVFIILEGKLDKKNIDKISKYAEKIQEFEASKDSVKKTDFNIFELSDALGKRDRKRLWVLYQTGKLRNVSDEEMHGILFWSTKNMILAKNSKNAKQAGLSPFVFGKAKEFGDNFNDQELKKISGDLVRIYHEGRRGIKSFDIGLEQFVLELK